jgi:hypothetical protein
MAKWWKGAALMICWMGLPVLARAQYLPGPAGPAPIQEPAPIAKEESKPPPKIPEMPEPGIPPLLSEKTWPIGEDSGTAFTKPEECPPDDTPILRFEAGVLIFTQVRTTNNPAYTITTTNPALARFIPNSAPNPTNSVVSVPTNNPPGIPTTTQFDFQFGTAVAPVLDLKIAADNGLGLRVGWFGFEQSARSLRPSTGGSSTPLGVRNGDVSAGIIPFGRAGNTTIRSGSPFPTFGVVSPDTSQLLDPLLAPGIPMPIGPGGPGDQEPNFGPVQGVAQSLQANGVPGDQFSFANHLKVDVWDLEASKDFWLDRLALQVRAGVRYAYISQSYVANRFHPTGAFQLPTVENLVSTPTPEPPESDVRPDDIIGVVVNRDDATLVSSESYYGVGPTLAFGIQYQIQPLFGIIVFGNVRGSVLFGRQKQTAFQLTHFSGTANQVSDLVDDPLDPPETTPAYLPTSFSASTFNQNELHRSQTVPEWDFSLGLEWGHDLGRAGFYVQAAVVGQEWHNVGNANSLSGDLRLFGLSVTTGFDY